MVADSRVDLRGAQSHAVRMPQWIDTDRASGYCPIHEREAPFLEALGSRLRQEREGARLSRVDVAVFANLHPRSVERIEAGTRRTRRSTLVRITRAFAPGADAVALLGELERLAGPTLRANGRPRA